MTDHTTYPIVSPQSTGPVDASRYRFLLHGMPLGYATFGRRSRTPNQSGRLPYAILAPAEFTMASFAAADNLMAAYRILRDTGGHAPGDDYLTFSDFSNSEIFAALRAVSRAIRGREYHPHQTRPVYIPRPGRQPRELRLQRITDRAVAKALQICLHPYWASVLPNLTRDVWTLLAQLEHAIRQRGWYTLATDDIRDCFPSLRISDILDCHRQHTAEQTSHPDEPPLRWLVETVIRGHEGPDRTVGLDQGSPYSPPSTELALYTILDKRLEGRGQGYPLLMRYVDNLTFLASSAHEGRQALAEVRNTLAPYALTLKGEDGDPVDVRDREHGRVVLGLIPVGRGDHLGFRVPEPAYDGLREGLREAWNHPDPVCVARQVLRGWILARRPAIMTEEDGLHITRRAMEIAQSEDIHEVSQGELMGMVASAHQLWLRERMQVVQGGSRHPSG